MCRALVSFAVAAALAACGRDPAVLAPDLGREGTSLQAAPAPTRWEVGFTASADLARQILGAGAWPSTGLELDLDPESIGRFDVSFQDDTGRSLAYGDTPFVAVAQLPGRRLSLFVQRRGELARPSPDLDPRTAPLLAVAGERLLIVGGGDGALAAHDLALGIGLARQSLTITPQALGATPSALFGASGGQLVRFDLQTAETSDAALPSGVVAAELAGAPMLPYGNGFAWVGPARAGEGSSAIVFVDDASVQSTRIPETRADLRVATLADGALLLVGEGVAFRAGTDGVTPYPLPALTTLEAVAVLADGTVLAATRAEGVVTIQRVAAGCDATCTPEPLGALPCVARLQLASLGSEALLACEDEGGQTRAFRLGPSPVELALREARRGATLVRLGRAAAALVGGGSASFERYRPL